KVKFVSGAVRNGVHADVIEAVWKDFEPFARYGFNRAHAAIYGIIAYHTAYLKANYTTEYMTAVLSAEMGTPDRIAIAVAECRRMGLAVLPPDVNESELDFAYTPKGIRVGLVAELGMSGQLDVKFVASPNSRFVDAPKEKLAWEKELLGIYLSAHPLNALAPRMKDVENLVALAELNEAGEDLVTIACVVTSARKHITKNKQL